MPTVRPISVVSFSSEDPNNPASNLLKGETFRKWKCKEAGEKVAYVILKLEKAVTITGIDIGNEHSAFVEVQVARSGQTPEKFQTLLSQSSFMTPQDSRNSTSTNRVRMFGLSKFDKAVAEEKWDLVKVICVQEFNTHVQFGISFINITAAADPNEKPKIGGFSMRPALGEEDDDEPEPVRIGSLFAKKMQGKEDASPKNGSAAAAIRTASSSLANAAINSSAERVEELKKQKVVLSHEEEDIKIASRPASSSPATSNNTNRNKSWYGTPVKKAETPSPSYSPTASPPRPDQNKSKPSQNGSKTNSQSRPTASPSTSSSSASSSKQKKTSTPKQKKKKKLVKPFCKLLEDVVFVMSGYQNPYRSELRRKACEMGARCKPDWDRTCTHLICAFVNTPKFREVRQSGHGKIVKKDWIEACYADKLRHPWRRYCLDWNDKGDESEEEIHAELSAEDEEMEIEEEGADEGGFSNRRRREAEEEEEGDDEEGNKRSRKRGIGTPRTGRTVGEDDGEEEEIVVTPKKRKRILVFDDEDEEDEGDGNAPVGSNEKTGAKRNVLGGKEEDDRRNDAGDDDDDQLSESYLADTDVEEEGGGGGEEEEHEDEAGSPSMLANCEENNADVGDFFDGNVFLFHLTDAGNGSERENIERVIRAHKGEIETSHNSRVEFVLTDGKEWKEEFSEAMAENPNLTFVRWEWIAECEKKNGMIPVEPFMILPN